MTRVCLVELTHAVIAESRICLRFTPGTRYSLPCKVK